MNTNCLAKFSRKPCAIVLAGFLAFAALVEAQEPTGLRLQQKIPLPNVEGRIDHLAVDVKGQRLFVAALGNNTVEVLDLRAGRRIHTMGGFHEPQGLVYLSEFNRLFVANRGDGTCRIMDGNSFNPIKTLHFSSDADNIRYDPATKLLYVGYGDGAVGVIEAASLERHGEIEVKGHPESFQLERSGQRIFVNVPADGNITVLDRHKRTVLSRWPVVGAGANFPMALDETNHRLFVGCRKPARLLVLDTTSSKTVATAPIAGDTDDLFYDAGRKRIYASCGEGFIDVLEQRDPDHYQPSVRIPTAGGARTSLWAPDWNRLYLAVPHRGNQAAAVWVYEAQP